ncbi:MAG: molecular chaperone HtpG [Spirochaetes bacterium]|nr:molecular chaperone HtpG [Spirochaetota bacterium]
MERKETLSFQAHTKQLLDLMIHSIYTHKEIFLRELISNSSDALDKLRFKALTDPSILGKDEELLIEIKIDEKNRSISVSDNGIGMTYEEVINNIGTIANSGSKAFFEAINKEKDNKKGSNFENLELIGQFGVGFYSSFMVAKKVVILTKSPFSEKGVRWESKGDGEYTIEDYDKATRGTKIILYLRDKKEENDDFDYDELLKQYKIESLVKKYSDFIRYPIKMEVEIEEYPKKDDGTPDYDKKPIKKKEIKTLNSMQPIWQKDKSSVKDEEYFEFYKSTFHDWTDPLDYIYIKGEGTIEFKALLFIPKKAPFDLYSPEYKKGLRLYSKNVFIMENCEEILPDHFKFIKGLVDSPDFSLNISREILQHTKQLKTISKNIEKKIYDKLISLMKDKRKQYEDWFKDFGTIIKTGIYQDFSKENTKLKDLLVFESTYTITKEKEKTIKENINSDKSNQKTEEGKESEKKDLSSENNISKMTTLKEYVERMKKDQDKIYYISGKDKNTLLNIPQMEAIKEKGYEVLLFLDNIDEFIVPMMHDYEGKQFQSVLNAEIDKEKKEIIKTEEETSKELLNYLKEILKDKVVDVRFTTKLKESPACVVSASEHMSLQMEKILSEFEKIDFPKIDKILEINPEHEVYKTLKAKFAVDAKHPDIYEIAHLLYDQAMLAQGFLPEDPINFAKKIATLISKAF